MPPTECVDKPSGLANQEGSPNVTTTARPITGHEDFVDIRTSKPIENLYKNVFESNRGYAWKQDCNRLRKMLQKITVCSFFYAFEIKEGSKEDSMKVGESKVGIGLQDIKILCSFGGGHTLEGRV